MKKATTILIMLVIVTSSFSQQTDPAPTLAKQDFLKKSKTQKTVAWVLLGTGVFSTMLSTIRVNEDIGGEEGMTSAQTILLITGIAEIGTSVILFTAAARNKKKAMSLAFKNETIGQQSDLVYKTVPSLTVKISL